MRRLIAIVTALIVLGTAAGCAGTIANVPAVAVSRAELSVEGAWVRTTATAKDVSMTAAFLTVVNPGDADVKLTSADCAEAGVVQLHEMVMQDGKMIMQEARDGIAVPAGSDSHLVPGGYHIMLMMLKKEFAVGDQVALTLHFSDGGTLQVSAPVKEFVEEEDHHHSPLPVATASS